jgi:uncharacterized phiE125 gp8 family phage protein
MTITVDRAARHLRVVTSDPDYQDVPIALAAAVAHVERYLNATITQRERVYSLDRFPSDKIELPVGPVISVEDVDYLDPDGDDQTFTDYVTSGDIIAPAAGKSWPPTINQIGSVTITYTAGMVQSPQDIDSGILLVLADLWDNRSAGVIGAAISVNQTLDRLLCTHRREMGV